MAQAMGHLKNWLFALLIGYVAWDELPNPLAWMGIGLLVVSGLLILRSERSKIPH
jgi:drug/metabolite transporter (DMT)-like permease